MRKKTPRTAYIIAVLGVFFSFFLLSLILSTTCAQEVNQKALKNTFEGRAQQAEVKVIAILEHDDLGEKFSFPAYLAYDSVRDELYIVDTARGKIIIFSPDLFPIFSLGKGRGVISPAGLTIDKEGNIYLCQGSSTIEPRPHLSIFNGAAIKVKDIFFSGFKGAKEFVPRSIALGKNGHLYVTGLNYKGLIVLDKSGHYLKTIAPKDSFIPKNPPHEVTLSDVFVDANGRLYLLSEAMGRFYVYDENEKFLFKGGQKGGGPGKLSRPRGICADPKRGLIYVVDYMRHTGQAYDYNTGKLKFEFGGRGWSPGWFNYPTDIMVDKFGRIYVADLFNHRVQVLEVWRQGASFPFSKVPSFLPLEKE